MTWKTGRRTHPNRTAKRKKKLRSEDSLRDLWDNIKRKNIHIIGVPEVEEGKKGAENLFEEIMAENLSKQTSRSRNPRELQLR